MKFLATVFVSLLAFAAADPRADQRANERFVDGIVAGAIEDLSNQIRENGLDPLVASEAMYMRLPVTDLLVLKGHIEDLLVEGLSNIVLTRVNYSILTSRLTFEIHLPLIAATIESSGADVTLFGYNAAGSVRGSLDIVDIRVSGDVRLSIGIISGISVRSIAIDFTLGGVRSDLEINVLGKDISDKVNELAATTIPTIIAANRNDLNRVLEHYIKQAIEANL